MYLNKTNLFLAISICLIFFFLTYFDVKSNKLKIIDGDTIHLNGEKIRFSGIDTPEIKQDTGKKGRLRKDRYSALLMGNMLARQSRRQPSAVEYDAVGGAMIDMPNKADGDYYITAPTWYKDGMNNLLNEI